MDLKWPASKDQQAAQKKLEGKKLPFLEARNSKFELKRGTISGGFPSPLEITGGTPANLSGDDGDEE